MKTIRFIIRAVGTAAAVVFLIWFIAPVFVYGVLNIGNIAGVALCVWTLLLCVAPLQRRLSRFCRRFFITRWLYRIINIGYGVFMLYGAVVTAAMLFASAGAPAENATAVVLGAQVSPDGQPTRILNQRILAAERYLNDNPEAKAVLTGGKGTDEVISEADCMYNKMVADGISPERLYKENQATDTVENFRFSQRMIEANNLNPNLAVTTDGFHQFRARLIAQKQGITAQLGAVSAETEWIFVPTYAVREWFALPLLLVK